jgi:hypothetical protein
MNRTELKQLRKAKAKAEGHRRHKVEGSFYRNWPREHLMLKQQRIAERLHFLIIEGRGGFWFRKRGLPNPTPANIREDLQELKNDRLNLVF